MAAIITLRLAGVGIAGVRLVVDIHLVFAIGGALRHVGNVLWHAGKAGGG
jgi:hypothetical protein